MNMRDCVHHKAYLMGEDEIYDHCELAECSCQLISVDHCDNYEEEE